MTIFGVTSSGVAQAASHHSQAPSQPVGPGYPPPGGIYWPFTNCPLLNPLMQESGSGNATGCVAGVATSGVIKIGNITTQVVHPVIAQFGLISPPAAAGSSGQFTGGLPAPPAGVAAELSTSPEYVPGGLLKALGCPNKTSPVLTKLCTEAKYYGGSYLDVYASAQEALPVTNFGLTTWTQPIKIQLINPLLGPNCYIGTDDSPIVVNPSVTGTLGFEQDPNPTKHPSTAVLFISGATASDTTFSAPAVIGCGPGGSANIPVDLQLDSFAGLPAASGSNALSLTGNFYIADNFYSSNQANILLSAFKASVGLPPVGGPRQGVTRFTFASVRGHFGIK